MKSGNIKWWRFSEQLATHSQGQTEKIPSPGYTFRHVVKQIDRQSCSVYTGAVLAACSLTKSSSSVQSTGCGKARANYIKADGVCSSTTSNLHSGGM